MRNLSLGGAMLLVAASTSLMLAGCQKKADAPAATADAAKSAASAATSADKAKTAAMGADRNSGAIGK